MFMLGRLCQPRALKWFEVSVSKAIPSRCVTASGDAPIRPWLQRQVFPHGIELAPRKASCCGALCKGGKIGLSDRRTKFFQEPFAKCHQTRQRKSQLCCHGFDKLLLT